MIADAFDYVVVGTGSAGGVIAARLSEDPAVTVCVLEAGPMNRNPILHIPAAARYAFHARPYNWGYQTEPEPALGGRRLSQPRGRVLGGSSSINGMVFLRGHPLDYEGWAQAGCKGWSYAEVLPYFQRLEGRVNPTTDYQGRDGPVGVSTPEPANPISTAFVEAAQQTGYVATEDVNGHRQEGAGRFPMNGAGGYRWSTARAYLRPALKRTNLDLRTTSEASKIIVEEGRARAVVYDRGGREERVTARREVIVSAGAINAPKLLMHSGIGPGAHLRDHGIDIVCDLPGVGQNLMDHQISAIQMACAQPVSLHAHNSLWGKAKGLVRWLATRDGVLASNHFESGAFVRSEPGVRYPDLQFFLFPIAVAVGSKEFYDLHGFQVQISPQRSLSRGHVRLTSGNYRDPPEILFNCMAHERDWIEFRKGFRLAREILAQPAMDAFRGAELSPGADVRTDGQLDDFIRDTVDSGYHPSGTCAMGTGAMAVVDPECRVRGVDGLRVACASVMPTIVSANLNAPTMMIGERASDLIRGKQLAPSNLDFFVDPEWKTRQRPGTAERSVVET